MKFSEAETTSGRSEQCEFFVVEITTSGRPVQCEFGVVEIRSGSLYNMNLVWQKSQRMVWCTRAPLFCHFSAMVKSVKILSRHLERAEKANETTCAKEKLYSCLDQFKFRKKTPNNLDSSIRWRRARDKQKVRQDFQYRKCAISIRNVERNNQ